MKLDLHRIAAAVNGKVQPHGAHAEITGVSTDSRKLVSGELFVALHGPNFDGHDYLAAAAAQGALAALCDHPLPDQLLPQVIVSDTLRALGDLAAFWRSRFSVPVAAITGSSGKTTTKEMLAAILAVRAPGLKTAGNLNNLIGLPLTLCTLSAADHWAVLEMGMSERGEIARLTEIAAPNVAIITNVAPAHLLTLKNLEGIARAKGELFARLHPGAVAVVNLDDAKVATIPIANGVQRITCGTSAQAEIRAEAIRTGGAQIRFHLHTAQGDAEICLDAPGRHNVNNALCAAAAALAMGYTLEEIITGLAAFQPVKGRMETVLLSDGIVLIEDTYNANPLSVKAALVALDEMGGSGRRIAVLGDMLELGETSAELHREVGLIVAQRCDRLFVLGSMGQEIAAGAVEGGMPNDRIEICSSHAAAAAAITKAVHPGDRIIVKGSRGMKMELITSVLRERYGVMTTKG